MIALAKTELRDLLHAGIEAIDAGVLDVTDASDVGILCRAIQELCVDDRETFREAFLNEWENVELQEKLGLDDMGCA